MLNNLIFDRELLSKRKIRAANSLAKDDFLIKRSFQDIKEKLSEMNRDFPVVLNLGARDGYNFSELLEIRGAKKIIETNLDLSLLKNDNPSIKIVMDEENIVFADNKFDLIISVLNLHSVNDLPGCFIRLKESLKPNGVLIASMFGESNLFQLGQSLMNAELDVSSGVSPRVMPSIRMDQLGGLLQRAGFILPVVDSDNVEVHYNHPLDLIRDLRDMGETNIMFSRNKTYLGRKFWNKFVEFYIRDFSTDSSEVIANFEILNLIALKN